MLVNTFRSRVSAAWTQGSFTSVSAGAGIIALHRRFWMARRRGGRTDNFHSLEAAFMMNLGAAKSQRLWLLPLYGTQQRYCLCLETKRKHCNLLNCVEPRLTLWSTLITFHTPCVLSGHRRGCVWRAGWGLRAGALWSQTVTQEALCISVSPGRECGSSALSILKGMKFRRNNIRLWIGFQHRKNSL